MDAWWLNVIGAVLISGCVQNMDAHGINVSKSLPGGPEGQYLERKGAL